MKKEKKSSKCLKAFILLAILAIPIVFPKTGRVVKAVEEIPLTEIIIAEEENTDIQEPESDVKEEKSDVQEEIANVQEEIANVQENNQNLQEPSAHVMPLAVSSPTYTVNRVNKGKELNELSTNFSSIVHGTAYPTISNYGGWAISDRSDIVKRMVYNPYSMFGDPADPFTATWYNIGTINGQSVNAVLTISGFWGALDAGDPLFGTNTHTVFLGPDFWDGVLFTHLHGFDAELSLYYASGSKINLSGMYTTFGSLQGNQQVNGWTGFEGVKINYNGNIQAYTLPCTRANIQSVTGIKEINETGVTLCNDGGVYDGFWYGSYYEFDDSIGTPSFLKSCVGFRIPESTLKYTIVSGLGSTMWYSMNISPFGAAAASPIKEVWSGGSNVNGGTVNAGNIVTYVIGQPMPILGVSSTDKYTTMVYKDTLPAGVSCTAENVSFAWWGNSKWNYLVRNQDYTVSKNGQAVTLTVKNPGNLAYDGRTYSMLIDASVNANAPRTLTNTGSTVINGHSRNTNAVKTTVAYKISTAVTNGTITAAATGITSGSAKKISYHPHDGYRLLSVTVDGAEVDRNAYSGNYMFSNIISNHSIKVVYEKIPDVSYSVKKQWWDEDNRDGKRPSSIVVTLYRSGDDAVMGCVTLTEAEGWIQKSLMVPLSDSMGNEMSYYWVESVADGYTAAYISDQKNQVITNSYVPQKKKLTVKKVWDDWQNEDGKRPVYVEVQLYANGTEAVTAEGKETKAILSESNGWSFTTPDLYVNSGGKAITYEWKENVAAGYHVSYQVSGDTTTITNVYQPVRRITVTKKIKAGDINFSNGNPTFLLKLTGMETGQPMPRIYYKLVTFTPEDVRKNTDAQGYVVRTVVFDNLEEGIYVVSEEETSRYQRETKDITVDLTTANKASTLLVNRLYESRYYSDCAHRINVFKY